MSMNAVYAHPLVKDTKHICDRQYTIPQLPEGGYDGLLTEEGERLLNECLEKVREGKFKDTFSSWTWDHVNSGSWFEPNKLVDPIIGARGFIVSRNNLVVVGVLDSSGSSSADTPKAGPDKELQTSSVRFWGDGWCQTISGSLYAIPSNSKKPNGGDPLLINQVW